MTDQSRIRVVSTGATAEEIAAATVVLEGALEELATERDRGSLTRPSRWSRSQVSLRPTIVPGDSRWGSSLR